MRNTLLLFATLALAAPSSWAAIGCTLSNPAQDLKYLYPEMTTYREDLVEFPRLKDGRALFQAFRERLGSDLDPIYETFETPYTVYGVFRGAEKIGIVHGVNVPGRGGVIQVFLAMDPNSAQVRHLFFQRLESPAARQLRSKDFLRQFESLTLADFYKHDYYAATGAVKGDKVASIRPAPLESNARADYDAALRGVRKNLILLDFFVYERRFEPFFERARQAVVRARAEKE